MSFLFGFALGAAVTVYMFYRKRHQTEKNAAVRKAASNKNSDKKEDEYL